MQSMPNHQEHQSEPEEHQVLFKRELVEEQSNFFTSQLKDTDNKTWMDMVIQKFNLVLAALIVLLIIIFLFMPSDHLPQQSPQKHQHSNSLSPTTLKTGKSQDNNILQIYNGNQQQQQKQPINFSKDHKKDTEKSNGQNQSWQQRSLYHNQRTKFFKAKQQKKQHFQYLKLAKYNLNVPNIDLQERQILFEEEQQRLQQKYRISQYKEQISICAVVYSHFAEKKYSHQYVINSIFNQNYRQFSIVYIADGHTQDQIQPIQSFITNIDPNKKIVLVWNEQRKYFLKSVMTVINSHCMTKKVTVLVDGNDQLLGKQVFKLLNTFYRRYNLNMVYGNFLWYHELIGRIQIGFSSEYEQKQKNQASYRLIQQKFGSIMSFRTNLIDFLLEADLKDDKGEYYKTAGDYALIYPLLELSCGLVRYIPEYNYLYYGQKLDPQVIKWQTKNGLAIKSKSHYKCFKEYT